MHLRKTLCKKMRLPLGCALFLKGISACKTGAIVYICYTKKKKPL